MEALLALTVLNIVWTIVNIYIWSNTTVGEGKLPAFVDSAVDQLDEIMTGADQEPTREPVADSEEVVIVWLVTLVWDYGKNKLWGVYNTKHQALDIAESAVANGVGDSATVVEWDLFNQTSRTVTVTK